MSLTDPMRYDPDVYAGSICHQDLGPHKHTLIGAEPFMGLVFTQGEDGMLVSKRSIGRLRARLRGNEGEPPT